MTASVLKQDPNTKRFKRTLINFNTDTACLKPKQDKSFSLIFIVFDRLSVVQVSFYGLIMEVSPKICILCVRVKINKRSFEPFCV